MSHRIFSATSLVAIWTATQTLGVFSPSPTLAQSIRPARDGTGTQIQQRGDRYNIEGGSLSEDRRNLFHSFDRFDLDPSETANFLTDPAIQNVLGRINGGTSTINGLLQLSGSNANLFLLNPAGIVFGSQARLDVPAAFFATTASGVGFANGGWFNATGTPDYNALVGLPTAFRFDNPGDIVSSGRLVTPDTLALLAENVTVSGELTANRIVVRAVPSRNTLQLSQPGFVLSLEIPTGEATLLDLPQLLTGGNARLRDTITRSQTLEISGDTVRIEASDLNASQDAAVVGNTVEFRDRSDTPLSLKIGQTLQLYGRDLLDIAALQHLDPPPFQIGGDLQLMSQGLVSADSHFQVGGDVFISGTWRSLFDPIVLAEGDVNFGDYTGASLKIEAGGSILGENITITQPDVSLTGTAPTDPDIALLTTLPSLILRAGEDVATPDVPDGFITLDATPPGDVRVGNLDVGTGSSLGGAVIIEASGAVTVGNVNTAGLQSGGAISILGANDVNTATLFSGGEAIRVESTTGSVTTGNLISTGQVGGDVTVNAATTLTAGNIDAEGIAGNGGNVTATATDNATLSSVDVRGRNSGGRMDLTQSRLQVTGFVASGLIGSETISLATSEGGSIRVEVSDGTVPFTVGDATANGTVGSLAGGDTSLTPTFEVPGGRFVRGNITVISPQEPLEIVETPEEIEDREDAEGEIERLLRIPPEPLPNPNLLRPILSPEVTYTNDFVEYLQLEPVPAVSLAESRAILQRIERETGRKPALTYLQFLPSAEVRLKQSEGILQVDTNPSDDRLELMVVTADGEPVRVVLEATRSQVLEAGVELRGYLTNPRLRRSDRYLEISQQLYDWLIRPLEKVLGDREVDNLTFIADAGLRTLPVAALHDGEQFLIERYSVGTIPSLSLTDTTYQSLQNTRVLAMGASIFPARELLSPLPAVPTEIVTVSERLWEGAGFLNEAFTLENLQQQRERTPYGIIHLATHGEFVDGEPSDSYIQFWDSRLSLDRLRTLEWNDPAVELLVLSACRTAVGSVEAELGFAGLAVAAGVKSALGSFWYVSDAGTLGLMTEFYTQLRSAPTKAEALRRAQVALLRGEVRVEDGVLIGSEVTIPLPPELSDRIDDKMLTHPYYWSAFTLVGSPW